MHAHVRQARHGAPCRIGVDRREQQVARQRRSHGHLRRIAVANLAQHDDVRVLPQERAQRTAERQPDLLLQLRLVDPFERILDGVFDRQYVVRRAVQPPQRGVERRALARACRSADQHHAELPCDRTAVIVVLAFGKAQVFQFQQFHMAGQEAQHHLLAVDRR